MNVYKELEFRGNKEALEELSEKIYEFYPTDWVRPTSNSLMEKYITADYIGYEVPRAEVSIYYGSNAWREGYVKVGNIVPLEKSQLTIEEYNEVLDLFYKDIVEPYAKVHTDIEIIGPTSAAFEPLNHITETALAKLEYFCNNANKSTGSSHPSDEERWFDFICQTVEDEKVFDYDTLYKFLMDKDYWGNKKEGFIGVIGRFAWSEEKASELALEYENYVRFLEYYRGKVR